MIETNFKNRYRDIITLRDNEAGQITMSGYSDLGVRILGDATSGNIEAIDPPGGPYLSLGLDLKEYFTDDKYRIITNIEFKDKTIVFTYGMSNRLNEDTIGRDYYENIHPTDSNDC